MKKFHAALCIALAILVLATIPSVHAQQNHTVRMQVGRTSIPSADLLDPLSISEAHISTPNYPIGLNSGESKLVEYSVAETANVPRQITSRTLQFFTQYDVPLSEPMGPFPTHVSVEALHTNSWKELVYLPKRVVEKARSRKEYAVVLKTTFTGQTSAHAEFQTEARLLLLLPPAAFSKSMPANGGIVQPETPNLKWNSSVGAIDYEYCVDTIDNNSCDTNWMGTYWLGTYDTNAMLKNLPPFTTFYWQVRANNAAGSTYANNGKFWKFTSQVYAPKLYNPFHGEDVQSRRPHFEWSGVPNTINYILQISKTPNFSQIIHTATPKSAVYEPNVDLPAKTTLYWRVQVKNGLGLTKWSEVRSFITPNPPSVPVLTTPAANTLLTTYQPFFNWNDSVLAPGSMPFSSYEIQIGDDERFSSIAMFETNTEGDITDSDFTATTSLLPNMKYYWRVRAWNIKGEFSSWSGVRSFRTAMLPPGLLSPTATEQLFDKRPTFEWENADGATGYKLVISKFPNLSNPIRTVTTVGSVYALTVDLPANLELYWRVQATGPNGPSLWSETRSFMTANPPGVPILTAPVSNSLHRDYSPLLNWKESTVPANTYFMAYQVQVDNNPDFSFPEIDTFTAFGELRDSSYSQDYDLDANTRFYWRVRAYNMDMQYSAWSTVWNFRTALLPPEPVSVMVELTPPYKPTFNWTQVDGATSYTVQLSASPTFGTLLVNATTSNTFYIALINLPYDKTIYCRVHANGPNGPSGWATAEFQIP